VNGIKLTLVATLFCCFVAPKLERRWKQSKVGSDAPGLEEEKKRSSARAKEKKQIGSISPHSTTKSNVVWGNTCERFCPIFAIPSPFFGRG
jgi:hypothetical protein